MEVDPLAEEVAESKEVDDLGEGILPDDAVLLGLDDQLVLDDVEVPEDPVVITLRQATEVGVTSQVVEKVGADGVLTATCADAIPARPTRLDRLN